MKIIIRDTEPNSQCSWAPDLGFRDEASAGWFEAASWKQCKIHEPVIEYGRGSLNLQLSGQDHHCNQQVPLMCFVQCLWENLQILLEM